MKKTIFSLILIIAYLTPYAQSQSDSNYSFGLKLFSIEEFPKLLNEVRDNNAYQTLKPNGLVFKVNDNQISYRFQIYGINEGDYSFKNECNNCEQLNGKYKELNIKIGFERNLTYSKLQPFYGLDFGYKNADFSGKAKNTTTSAFLYNVDINKYAVVASPFIGFKYNFIKALTLSAEAGLDILFTTDKEIKSNSNNVVNSSSRFNRWQFANKPLGMLSLQFNFGSM
jgi:hypothetical protein